MRLISFSMTTAAFLDGRKTVTRRLGWTNLRNGDRLVAVEKVQGLKKGEKVRRLGEIEVVSVRRERLDAIDLDDVLREGLDGVVTPATFVDRFCEATGCRPSDLVTRIEFRKVESAPRCEARYANNNRDVHMCRREVGHGGRHVCDVAEWTAQTSPSQEDVACSS